MEYLLPSLLAILGLIAGAALLTFVVLVLANRHYNQYAKRKNSKSHFSSLGGMSRALLHEAWALWRVGSFRLRPTPRPISDAQANFFLVHGLFGHRQDFLSIHLALLEAGASVHALKLAQPWSPIEAHAKKVRDALFGAQDVIVVCHSMGGVVMRQALAQTPELHKNIRCVITIASPHAGTAAARGFVLLHPTRSLKRRSGYLKELPLLCEIMPPEKVITLAASHDLVVYPKDTCHEPSSQNIDIPGVGHVGILLSPETLGVITAQKVVP